MTLKAQRKAEEFMTRRGLKCIAVTSTLEAYNEAVRAARDLGTKLYGVHTDDIHALYISEVA